MSPVGGLVIRSWALGKWLDHEGYGLLRVLNLQCVQNVMSLLGGGGLEEVGYWVHAGKMHLVPILSSLSFAIR